MPADVNRIFCEITLIYLSGVFAVMLAGAGIFELWRRRG